jgi:sugar lactone lactonase YvrE
MRILTLGLVLAACAAPADPPPPPTAAAGPPPAAAWGALPPGAGAATEIEDLARSFPESAAVQRRRLAIALEDGDADKARGALRAVAEMGFVLSDATLERLAGLAGREAVDAARAAAAGRPVEASVAFAAVPTDWRLVEGVAWDARTGRLYASSVVSRALLVRDGEAWRQVDGVDSGSLFGLAVDAPRRLLWMASGVLEQTPSPDTAFRGLIALDLDTQRVVRRVAAPAGVSPADIAVAADGAVFASDPAGGGVYRLRPGAAAIETLVAPGVLRSPQGLAVAGDRARLYVADYGYGVAIVDLAGGAVSRLAAERPAMLDGIDGLLRAGGDLVAIQNGAQPRRIVRLRLDPSGSRITGIEVVERGHREWGEPTLGQIKEGDLLYVADAQWERYGAGGALRGEEPLRPTTIRIVPLRPGGEPPPG